MASMGDMTITLTFTAPITCGRCGRERKTFVEVGPNIRVLSREQMRGWFELEPGDWRCGCILKQQPEGDL